jgi:hypothetical protein
MTDDIEPYPEPDVEADDYPDEWTPKQRENWKNYGHFEYRLLETELGRYWFRRTYRPKMRNEGMMQRDHVKLGTPEDYVAYNVADMFKPMAALDGYMMRQLMRYDFDTDELDEAVEDIVQARRHMLEPEEREDLAERGMILAKAYGINLDA